MRILKEKKNKKQKTNLTRAYGHFKSAHLTEILGPHKTKMHISSEYCTLWAFGKDTTYLCIGKFEHQNNKKYCQNIGFDHT